MKTSNLQTENERKRSFLDIHISRLFHQKAIEFGDSIAIEFKNESLTYRQLDEFSTQVANYLRTKFVKSGDFVGMCVEKGLTFPIWILGILKAGGIYLPLIPKIPKLRMKKIFSETKCKILICSSTSKNDITKNYSDSLEHIIVDEDTFPILKKKEKKDELSFLTNETYLFGKNKKNEGSSTSCGVFTTGSTGEPKCVLVSSRNIVHLAVSGYSHLGLTKADKYASFASIVFTVSLSDVFTPLLNGQVLSIIPEEIRTSPNELMEYINEKKITCLHIPPSILKILPKKNFNHDLTFIRIGGELCDQQTMNFWSENKSVKNFMVSYGLSETCGSCLMKQHWRIGDEVTNIGSPFGSYKYFILDEKKRVINTPGVAGELYIEGAGVTNGYLNSEIKKNDSFINNPFYEELKDPDREYYRKVLLRTGDFCYFNEKREVIYKCRLDHQIKIRGNRIDLLEIENTIRSSLLIQDIICGIRRDKIGNKRLVGYIIKKNNSEDFYLVNEIKSYCMKRLQDYMIPSIFIFIEDFPKTYSGKKDRCALNTLKLEMNMKKKNFNSSKPKSETEKKIEKIWKDLLFFSEQNEEEEGEEEEGEEDDFIFSVDDEFFEVGGNSLLLALMLNRINESFGTNITVPKILQKKLISIKILSEMILVSSCDKNKKEGIDNNNNNNIVNLIRTFRDENMIIDRSFDPPIRLMLLKKENKSLVNQVLELVCNSFIGNDSYLGNPFYIKYAKDKKLCGLFRDTAEIYLKASLDQDLTVVSVNHKTGEILGCAYGLDYYEVPESSEQELGTIRKESEDIRNILELLGTAAKRCEESFENSKISPGPVFELFINCTSFNAPPNLFYLQNLCLQELARIRGFRTYFSQPNNPTTQRICEHLGIYTKHKEVKISEFEINGVKVYKDIAEDYLKRIEERKYLTFENENEKDKHRIIDLYSLTRKLDKPIEEVFDLI